MNGDDAIDLLARRLRDVGSTAHPRTLLATVLTQCHMALNISQREQRDTAMLSLDGRSLYRISEVAADVGELERVIVDDRALSEIHWTQLVQNDPKWLRTTGERPETWVRLGRTLLVVTPVPWEPLDVTVSYLVVPPAIVDAATSILWPEEMIPMLLDLAEGVMLCKARLYDAMDGAMSRLVASLSARAGAVQPWRKVNV